MGLFKTKAEKRAYAIGRRHQYEKEHPVTNYVVRGTTYYYDVDGSLLRKNYIDSDMLRCKTQKEAIECCNKQNENEKNRKERVLKAVKNKKVNIYGTDSYYTVYSVVKQKKRT